MNQDNFHLTSKKHRVRLRLKDYDYSQTGVYFITICTKNRKALIDNVEDREIILRCWQDLPGHYNNLILDEFIIMPDHVHGIIIIDNDPFNKDNKAGESLRSIHTKSLFEIVRAFKSFSSRQINLSHKTPGRQIWQRGYYEHVVRDEKELNQIRRYIKNNPFNGPV
jgi:putative transposase